MSDRPTVDEVLALNESILGTNEKLAKANSKLIDANNNLLKANREMRAALRESTQHRYEDRLLQELTDHEEIRAFVDQLEFPPELTPSELETFEMIVKGWVARCKNKVRRLPIADVRKLAPAASAMKAVSGDRAPKVMTLEEFMDKNFSSEFNLEAAREYIDVQRAVIMEQAVAAARIARL